MCYTGGDGCRALLPASRDSTNTSNRCSTLSKETKRPLMIRISFMTANYVARQLGWNMTEGWGQGDAASTAYFRPVETFEERLGEYLRDIRAMGFEALDMWTGVMDSSWA